MLVVNKIDIDPDGAKQLLEDHPGCVALSAKTGEGVADMLRTLADRLRGLSTITELLIPFDRGDLLAALHREGEVLLESPADGGMLVRARLDEVSVSRLHEYVVSGQTLRS
jgi:GTP-binding protein HflX